MWSKVEQLLSERDLNVDDRIAHSTARERSNQWKKWWLFGCSREIFCNTNVSTGRLRDYECCLSVHHKANMIRFISEVMRILKINWIFDNFTWIARHWYEGTVRLRMTSTNSLFAQIYQSKLYEKVIIFLEIEKI